MKIYILFYFKKRAEANIDLSRNEADTKVFEPAVFFNKKPIDPNPKTVYLYALLVGLIIPILYFVIHEIFNDKILTKKDLQNLTSIPIIGFIGKNYSGNTLLSKHSPKSVTFEGFSSSSIQFKFFIRSFFKQKLYIFSYILSQW